MFSIASYKFCIIYANNMRKILRGGCTYSSIFSTNKPKDKKRHPDLFIPTFGAMPDAQPPQRGCRALP